MLTRTRLKVVCTVNPVLDYATEVWGYVKNSSTDLVQLKAIRAFLGVHKFAPNPAIIGDNIQLRV